MNAQQLLDEILGIIRTVRITKKFLKRYLNFWKKKFIFLKKKYNCLKNTLK